LLESDVFSLDEDLALLSEMAKQAGQIALRFFGRDPKVWMKNGDKSPVSEADFAVDAYLKQTLLQARPDYGWLSEESADDRGAHSHRRTFIIDPIDGTRGFLDGRAQWCISVAIIEGGRPICGVLECPAVQEHYSVHLGERAKLNAVPLSAPIHSKNRPKIRISCSVTKARLWPQDLQDQLEFVPSIPSLAYRLALVAAGDLDVVVVRPNSHDWDIAAADIILRQSGIVLTNTQGQPVSYGNAPFRHDMLLAGHESHKQEIIPYL